MPSVCQPDIPPAGWTLIASYHTHGAYDPRADSEVPSPGDVEADFQEGVNGYVSTPGGRFWRIDAAHGVADMICGEGCLAVDPTYTACDAFAPKERYSVAELEARARLDTGRC